MGWCENDPSSVFHTYLYGLNGRELEQWGCQQAYSNIRGRWLCGVPWRCHGPTHYTSLGEMYFMCFHHCASRLIYKDERACCGSSFALRTTVSQAQWVPWRNIWQVDVPVVNNEVRSASLRGWRVVVRWEKDKDRCQWWASSGEEPIAPNTGGKLPWIWFSRLLASDTAMIDALFGALDGP